MSLNAVLSEAVWHSSPAQFLRLVLARERGDRREAREASRQLARLGVKVSFDKPA